MLKELASSLSWLDYGLIVIGAWWAWDHGGAAVAAKVKSVFTAGKADAVAVVARVEKLEAEVFGKTVLTPPALKPVVVMGNAPQPTTAG